MSLAAPAVLSRSRQRREGRAKAPRSPDSVGQCGLDRRVGAQGSQHDDRLDRGAGKLGRDIIGNAGKAQHMDVERLPGCTHRFEILAAVVPQTEVQTLVGYRALHRVGVSLELVANRGADEVSAVRV